MVKIEDIKKGIIPKHIAVIMDGNRRWAAENNLNPLKGHEAGVKALENLMKFFINNSDLGVKYVTIYALSTDNNSKRPKNQVDTLMKLFKKGFSNLAKDENIEKHKIKISVFGNYKALPADIVKEIDKCINMSKYNTGFGINFCIAYDGQDEISRACKLIANKVKNNELNTEDINNQTVKNHLFTANFPAPELIIRTGKVKRLSAFLLWDSSYSEFYFLDKYWPDMKSQDFIDAIGDFQNRQRNFGN